ncbi:MAG: serine--tRNA ligase [Candidatus Nealsonbacteria bacterium]
MLDIKFIRENIEKVKEACQKKQVKVDIDQLIKIDKKRRKELQLLEEIRAQKNKASKLIPNIVDKEGKDKLISEMKEIDQKGDELEESLKNLNKEYHDLMYQVPNIPFNDVPVGKDEKSNIVIREVGKKPNLRFKPKDHILLGESLDIIDTKRASKVSGARFNYLKGKLALLEFALIQYTFEILTSEKIIKKIANSIEKGYSDNLFIPIVPPVMVRPDVFRKMGRLTDNDKDERYYLEKDDLYLVGSAEHTLGPIHMDEVLDEKNLPLRYVGFSTSFRREAGSYGKDTRGILRVHQFDKIEIESFTTKENSLKEQNFIVAVQEYLVNSLNIPYQVVMISTGDMGMPDARQIDIECWMPGQDKYRETHTSDLMTDFQARRLKTRIKREYNKIEFAHMNDATVFAIGRILIAIIENYQQKDGSIKVPKVLQKYVNFESIKQEKNETKID